MLTVGVGQSPGRAYWTDSLRVRAISELIPVARVSLQILCLKFYGEVNVIGRKCFTRVNRFSRELGVVENFEGDADGDALIRTRSQRLSSRPKEDGVIERVTLKHALESRLRVRGRSRTLATA